MSKNRLNMNNELRTGENLTSNSLEYKATLQPDGNFVILTKSGSKVWETHTANQGGQRLVMQNNCNLVLYDSSGTPLWSSNTTHPAPVSCYLELEDDGCLKIFNNSNEPDGNFVILTKSGSKVWETQTANQGGQRLVMQNNCNLVLYDGSGTPLWSSNTTHPAPVSCYSELEDDGCLKIFNNSNEVWRSK